MSVKAVTATKKARVLVTGMYSNGVPLYEERAFVADARVLESPIPAYRCVEVRLIVPLVEAEELCDAIRLGETELYIENIPPRTSR
jgi:hypothetical protein